MKTKFYPLNYLKSRTFWQVTLALTVMTVLQVFSSGISPNNSLSGSFIDSQPSLPAAEPNSKN